MDPRLHPDTALFAGEPAPPALPACEHFAGAEKFIARAFALQADTGPVFDITCDCEDGAPAGDERAHAAMVAGWIASGENRFDRAGVRIHDVGHPAWRDDVAQIVGAAGARLAYITVPKVNQRADVDAVAEHVRAVRAEHGIARRVPLHVLIETHAGLRHVHDIAAHPEVEAIDFGLLDFVSAHGGALPADAMRSPGQFEHALLRRAKAEIAAAALGHGRVPSHNICMDVVDPAAAGADAARALREFGFLRMYSIHPVQIAPIVEAFRATEAEIAEATEVLLAALAAQWGPVRHAGRMQDRASYRHWWGVLRRAHAGGAALPDVARSTFFPTA
ncbi:MAG: aldolase/citrate lyase family protein [Burkholderiales bacterium]|nr:aldolase/citrate lyase family protein [Burkholderiales bacterium]